jgi:nitrogen fixation NifU-like protein
MSSDLDQMYREIILDHFRSPRGRKPLEHADIHTDGKNPVCGDEIALEAEIENGALKEIHVDCQGCAISVASGSILAEIVKGKQFDEVEKIAGVVKKILKGEIAEIPGEYGDLEALGGVRQFPVRIKCALLSWIALIEGIRKYAKGNGLDKTVISTEEEKE